MRRRWALTSTSRMVESSVPLTGAKGRPQSPAAALLGGELVLLEDGGQVRIVAAAWPLVARVAGRVRRRGGASGRGRRRGRGWWRRRSRSCGRRVVARGVAVGRRSCSFSCWRRALALGRRVGAWFSSSRPVARARTRWRGVGKRDKGRRVEAGAAQALGGAVGSRERAPCPESDRARCTAAMPTVVAPQSSAGQRS